MIKEITIPKIGYTMEEGTVVQWMKKVGDEVKAGEPVLEIASDKANVEIEAPADGILLKILAEEGDSVPVLHAVALMGDAGDTVSEGPAPEEKKPERIAVPTEKPAAEAVAADSVGRGNMLSPRARKFAEENAMDVSGMQREQGSGYKGMVVERDLKKILASRQAPAVSPDIQYATPTAIKRITATRLTQSVQEIPQFFVGTDADARNLLALKNRAEETAHGRPSITSLLVKCVSCAIRDNREKVNVSWADGRIVLHPVIRIGVAMATAEGLVVAVIDRPDQKRIRQIDAELKALSGKARDGKLSVEEMSGGTFTISNLGMYGVDEFNAIVNPPESGILAAGRIVKKAVVAKDDAIAVKPVMHLNLTVDHRVLDGADAARLLGSIKEYIEYPELML